MVIPSQLPTEVSRAYQDRATSLAPLATPAPTTSRGTRTKKDQVVLSPEVQELQRLLKAVKELPDVREERVAFIREQIQNGTYQISDAALASKLLEWEGLNGD